MSIIQEQSWQIILRNQQQVVLHHPQENLVTVKRILQPLDPTCPTCKRPWDEKWHVNSEQDEEESQNKNFVDSKYFLLLANSTTSPNQDPHRMNEDQEKLKNCANQGYYDKFFVEIKKLGRGQRGSVFLCRHILNGISLGDFAVKAIPVGTSSSWLTRMLREVKLLERLRHPNIIEYKHAWMEERQLSLFGPQVPCLFILMELANGGNLEEYLHVQWDPIYDSESRKQFAREKRRTDSFSTLSTFHTSESHTFHTTSGLESSPIHRGGIGMGSFGKQVRYLTEYEILNFFSDICSGLTHLHKHGIMHRDLKPSNLLLHFSQGDTFPRILISDFGECEVISTESIQNRTGATGTLEFMPPELLYKDEHGTFAYGHSPSADMWSLGVILYFLCYSHVPYSQTEDVDALKREILSFELKFPTDLDGKRVSIVFRNWIQQLLVSDASKRPCAERISFLVQEYKGKFTPSPQDSILDEQLNMALCLSC